MSDDIEPSYYWNDVKRALNEFLAERFRDCDRAGFNRRQPEVDALKSRIADLEARVLPEEIAKLLGEAMDGRSPTHWPPVIGPSPRWMGVTVEEGKAIKVILDWWRKSKGA